MLIVRCDNSVMNIDVMNFLFGDGEWVVTICGDSLFE